MKGFGRDERRYSHENKICMARINLERRKNNMNEAKEIKLIEKDLFHIVSLPIR
jgi:hypothetical protein